MERRPKKKKKYHKDDFKTATTSPVKAKKHLGQHFLTDESVAQRIGETLTNNGYDNVVEIGPGTGVLTKYILKNAIHLIAMDLDTESIAYLNENFSIEHASKINKTASFKVIEADFLKFDLASLFNGAPFAITGNFPYNISSQIVFKAIEFRHLVPEFTGMFQKEVAQRICEKEGSKAYGILSVLTQAYYNAEYLFTVGPEVFNPPPKVDSGVLRLTRKEDYDLPCDEKLFKAVVKQAFNQRRKTLRNSLKSFEIPEEKTENNILQNRPEQLSVADFIKLTQLIERI
ncbi:16S rRNA (adenine(1518)-N(6)/adenine(1519)-N(6))-dimethyltransferase RsmA [Aquimarina agarilytica]|uniref:16S rRNA (adenine(1518)-N(6)/adenine(1519)-N(6))- dimethyltransferase RsmA n=1 Tax=Aquimarina agarilytica TaxID=1087449 RepID=UPI000287BC19|nr:16S rRNA (adenine(1518)-N(6)/adenine(1519)-N(6))-dimethyltransferase RsmA [Aquimarina agarilytica]